MILNSAVFIRQVCSYQFTEPLSTDYTTRQYIAPVAPIMHDNIATLSLTYLRLHLTQEAVNSSPGFSTMSYPTGQIMHDNVLNGDVNNLPPSSW
jgi:hypothetical protein